MPHINLLPWREEQRRQRNKDFGAMCFLFAVLILVTVGSVHFWFTDQIGKQSKRNNFVEEKITELDMKIKEIKELDAEKDALEARMTIIQELQSSRPEIVHLFDEVVSTLPEGIFYTKITQKGRSLTLTGVAQSNARVSSLMRNIEGSEWMKNPKLKEIKRDQKKATEQETLRLSNFILTTSQQGPKVKAAGEDLGAEPEDESS
jgi:type IV pilus assembly protein PilN